MLLLVQPARFPIVSALLAAATIAGFTLTYAIVDADPFALDRTEVAAARVFWEEHPYLKVPPGLERYADTTVTEERAVTDEVRAEQTRLNALWSKASQGGSILRRLSLSSVRGPLQVGWLSALFVHAGWLELMITLVFLLMIGPVLEDTWGRGRFGAFYVAAGVIGAAAQFFGEPESSTLILGASGAIAACVAALLIRFTSPTLITQWSQSQRFLAWVTVLGWISVESLSFSSGWVDRSALLARLAGFAVGLLFAAAMKVLSLEKGQTAAEKAQALDSETRDMANGAFVSMKRGHYENARDAALEVLKRNPRDLPSEIIVAEIDVRSKRGPARLERVLRRLLAENRAGEGLALLQRVDGYVQPADFTPDFLWELAQAFFQIQPRRDESLIERMLVCVASQTGGRFIDEANLMLAEMGVAGEVHVTTARAAISALKSRRASFSATLNAKVQRLDDQLNGVAPRAPTHALTDAPKPMPSQQNGVTLSEATFVDVSRDGVVLTITNGKQLTVPFNRIKNICVTIAPLEGRRILFIDLLIRREASSETLVLRLTSKDQGVPRLFPTLKPGQAWMMFIDKVAFASNAPTVPDLLAMKRGEIPVADSVEAISKVWTNARSKTGTYATVVV